VISYVCCPSLERYVDRQIPSVEVFTTSFCFCASQIEDIHLVRDEDTGKSRGFAFVKYEDARSCAIAVDNLIGSQVSPHTPRT